MSATMSCAEVATLMTSDSLYAVFDVRERGEYNDCQIANATSLPRSQIEFAIDALVPNRAIPLVVYDEGGVRAELAADTLVGLGYQQVSILDGGLSAWREQGRQTVSGVNVPSKAFGEKVHHERQVPDLSAEELKNLIDSHADLTILDMRTPEEFGRFCIPGGVNVPGGDVILWAEQMRRQPAVIVNCAGRTRSIIGAAGLRRLGLTNVRALRNGTMGWLLAGFELETRPARRAPVANLESRVQAVPAAQRLAAEEHLPGSSVEELIALQENPRAGVTYLIDVRSEQEFAAGHIASSINVPGGQAVQRADDFIPVRNAEIVFISNQSARAVMAAYWYQQMGFRRARVLEGGIAAWQSSGRPLATGSAEQLPRGFGAATRATHSVDAATLQGRLARQSCTVIDVSTSLEYEASHVVGARWISRGWIDIKLPQLMADHAQEIVLTCRDGMQSTLAAQQLAPLGYAHVAVLTGGLRAWTGAGFTTESGLSDALVPANDVVLSPSIRGNRQDMQRYLDWELTLKR